MDARIQVWEYSSYIVWRCYTYPCHIGDVGIVRVSASHHLYGQHQKLLRKNGEEVRYAERE